MKSIPIKCSDCGKKALGLKTTDLKFDKTDEIKAFHFVKLYESAYELKPCAVIECPECKSIKYILDIQKVWKKEALRRKKNEKETDR